MQDNNLKVKDDCSFLVELFSAYIFFRILKLYKGIHLNK